MDSTTKNIVVLYLDYIKGRAATMFVSADRLIGSDRRFIHEYWPYHSDQDLQTLIDKVRRHLSTTLYNGLVSSLPARDRPVNVRSLEGRCSSMGPEKGQPPKKPWGAAWWRS